ncbi:hypothetical protein [Streptomyces sp. NPDC055085]
MATPEGGFPAVGEAKKSAPLSAKSARLPELPERSPTAAVQPPYPPYPPHPPYPPRPEHPPLAAGADAFPLQQKKHWFLWWFVAVQGAFAIWLIIEIRSRLAGRPVGCGELGDGSCREFQDAKTVISLGLVILIWAAVDVVLGSYAVICRVRRRHDGRHV